MRLVRRTSLFGRLYQTAQWEILPLQIICMILVAELSSNQCSTVRIRNRVKRRLFDYLQTTPPVIVVAVRKQCYTQAVA
jgi:hypothetical protein